MKTATNRPILLPKEIVDITALCGLPDEFRAEKNCFAYAEYNMSESEFIEMYEAGSDAYQDKCDATIFAIWKAMK